MIYKAINPHKKSCLPKEGKQIIKPEVWLKLADNVYYIG